MIVRYLLVALVAGLIAGGIQTVAYQAKVVPLILEAETYENAPAGHHEHTSGLILPGISVAQAQEAKTAAPEAAPAEEEGGMLFGVSRVVGTLMGNLVTGCGFALIMMAFSLVLGRPVTLANGVMWGAAGWLAFHLLPAVGLPPELPGFPAADLGERQTWWFATVAASIAALYLLVIRKEVWAKVAGVLVMLAPHLVGAPQPSDLTSNVPAVLASEFAVATLSAGLLFWVLIGLFMGALSDRVAKAA